MRIIKRLLTDPSFYGILALNIYFIFEFQHDRGQYDTIIWLYWTQSIIIGFFTFLEISTTSRFSSDEVKVKDTLSKQGCGTGGFFVIHYGFFHLVYFVFLASEPGFSNLDVNFYKIAILAVFMSQLVFFVQHKFSYRENPPSLGKMFIQPYIRIIPMHLTILLPEFIGLSPSLIFLVLRGILDLVGYIVTAPWFSARQIIVGKPDANL